MTFTLFPVPLWHLFSFPNSPSHINTAKSQFLCLEMLKLPSSGPVYTGLGCTDPSGEDFLASFYRSCTGWGELNKYFKIWSSLSAMLFPFWSSHLLKIPGTQSVSRLKVWGCISTSGSMWDHCSSHKLPTLLPSTVVSPYFVIPPMLLAHSPPGPLPRS